MAIAITVVSLVLSSVGHLLLVVLCFAGMPNSSERQMAQIKLWMLAIVLVWLAMAGLNLWLQRSGHPWWGATLNLASPIVMFIVLLKATTP